MGLEMEGDGSLAIQKRQKATEMGDRVKFINKAGLLGQPYMDK